MLDPQQQVTKCANVALCIEHKKCGSLLTLQGHFRIYHGDKMRVLAASAGSNVWPMALYRTYGVMQAVKSVLRLCGLRTRHDVQ